MNEQNKNEDKPKSLVVQKTTWIRLQNFIHHNGVKSTDDLINKMLDIYEKEVKYDKDNNL